MIKLLLALPYLMIIIIAAVIFQNTFISAITGIVSGMCYFGWILPEYNKRVKDND